MRSECAHADGAHARVELSKTTCASNCSTLELRNPRTAGLSIARFRHLTSWAFIVRRRNVLRDLKGGWTMCVNLEWQMCAVQGKLPGQGSKKVSFATAPKDLKVEWWEDPAHNPIMDKWTPFGCCAPDR